jgi:hypothetical protein
VLGDRGRFTGEGQKLYDVSTAGVTYTDTHQQQSRN